MPPKHPQKGEFIVDLRPGERVTGFYLVRHKQLEPFRDRSKGEFLTLALADRSGQMLARVWDGAAELAETFAAGDVVKVAADVEEYLNRTQLIVNKLRRAEEDEYDLADFLPATTKNIDELWTRVRSAAQAIQNPHLATLVDHFYGDPEFRARYEACPASPVGHHAELGGLLKHTAEVAAIARGIARVTDADPDLVLAGVLLHDIGKLESYRWDGPFSTTDRGYLYGHVVLGSLMLERAVRGADPMPCTPEELDLLQHLVLSHHGRQEFGAPVPPMTLEAEILHHADLAGPNERSQGPSDKGGKGPVLVSGRGHGDQLPTDQLVAEVPLSHPLEFFRGDQLVGGHTVRSRFRFSMHNVPSAR